MILVKHAERPYYIVKWTVTRDNLEVMDRAHKCL